MSGFIRFMGAVRKGRRHASAPLCAVNAKRISFYSGALELLDLPREEVYVALYWDPIARIVGMEFTTDKEAPATSLLTGWTTGKSAHTVSSGAFFKAFGLFQGQTYSTAPIPVWVDDATGYLCFQVDAPGVFHEPEAESE